MNLRPILITLVAFFSMICPASAEPFDHSPWDGLLKKTVSSRDGGRSTQIDYAAIQQSSTGLSGYLSRTEGVAQESFDGWAKAEQLAFLINVYNARTIELVLRRYPDISSIKDLGSLVASPWKKAFVPLFGRMLSLDDIEHGLIRGSGRYGDPRIHFAVNCASIGCPALRAEAYSGDRLDAQLEDQTRLFLSDRSRNRLKGGTLELSSIFKWYREDFEKGFRQAASLEAFLALHAAALGLDEGDLALLKAGELTLRYLKYDWHLNDIR